MSTFSGSIDVLHNLASSLVSVEYMLTGASYLMGIAFAMKALFTMKSHGEQRSSMGASSLKEAGLYIFVSAMLLYYPSAFEVIMNSTFGYSSPLAYASLGTTSPIFANLFGADSSVGTSLTIIIQVIGLIAFIRGWVMIARSSAQGQHGNIGKGLMHVFGGVLAMNIIGTLEVLYNTLFGM